MTQLRARHTRQDLRSTISEGGQDLSAKIDQDFSEGTNYQVSYQIHGFNVRFCRIASTEEALWTEEDIQDLEGINDSVRNRNEVVR